jgi:hypothetical protein
MKDKKCRLNDRFYHKNKAIVDYKSQRKSSKNLSGKLSIELKSSE